MENETGKFQPTAVEVIIDPIGSNCSPIEKREEYARRSGITPRQRTVCYMAAWGVTSKQIGQSVGMKPASVSAFLSKPEIKAEIELIQDKIWGDNPKKWIEKVLPVALQTAFDIMMDKKVKPQTRLEAAAKFMDRALGKPKQEIELQDGTLRQLLEALDNKQKQEVAIDANGEYIENDSDEESGVDKSGKMDKNVVQDEVDKVIEAMYGK